MAAVLRRRRLLDQTKKTHTYVGTHTHTDAHIHPHGYPKRGGGTHPGGGGLEASPLGSRGHASNKEQQKKHNKKRTPTHAHIHPHGYTKGGGGAQFDGGGLGGARTNTRTCTHTHTHAGMAVRTPPPVVWSRRPFWGSEAVSPCLAHKKRHTRTHERGREPKII